MATAGTSLNMVFKDAGDAEMSIRLNHADGEATQEDVNALMDTIIDRKSLWDGQPREKVSAEVVTVAVREIVMTAPGGD